MKPIVYDVKGFNSQHFPAWRRVRIKKLDSILGANWWPGKTVLELACGAGHIGEELQKRGAKVTFAEGRKEYIDEITRRASGSEVYQIDQDEEWDLGKRFDLVLHWGILYHLKNWRRDLLTALHHGNLLSLDTEVADSDDPNFEIPIEEAGFDQAMNGIGIRPSVAAIEKLLCENAKSFKRYDDTDLNVDFLTYSWKSGDMNGTWHFGWRRFWMIEC